MKKAQHLVDNAVFFQKSLPCKSPQKKIHPHRKNKKQHNKACPVDFHIRQHHSQRICQNQTDKGADKGQQKRKAECFEILHSADSQHIFKGKMPFAVGEAIVKNHGKRNQDKGHGPDQIRAGKQFSFIH